jgi:hypothetical protein
MWWLIAILVVIAAFAFPRFGKALLVLVGLAAVALFVIYQQSEQEESAARQRVTPQQVELTDLRLGPPQYGSSYGLTGRIRNASTKFSIKSLQLKITLRDCITSADCVTVGDRTTYIFVSVPPGQTRGISESIYFSNLPPLRGSFAWSYAIAEIKAD